MYGDVYPVPKLRLRGGSRLPIVLPPCLGRLGISEYLRSLHLVEICIASNLTLYELLSIYHRRTVKRPYNVIRLSENG